MLTRENTWRLRRPPSLLRGPSGAGGGRDGGHGEVPPTVVVGGTWAGPPGPVSRGWPAQACVSLMLTIQGMPNRSVHMPNTSPHICFSSGTATVPSADSFSQ